MKKLIVILIAVISFNGVFAQQGNRNQGNNQYQQNDKRDNKNYGGNQAQGHEYAYNDKDRRNDDYDRWQEPDRRGGQYDQRNKDYRNAPPMNNYQRNRAINQRAYERQPNRPTFGAGVAVGAAAILLGILIAH